MKMELEELRKRPPKPTTDEATTVNKGKQDTLYSQQVIYVRTCTYVCTVCMGSCILLYIRTYVYVCLTMPGLGLLYSRVLLVRATAGKLVVTEDSLTPQPTEKEL